MSKPEIQWWADWLDADYLKRRKMIEKLSFINEVQAISKNDTILKKYKKHIIVTLLNSFFEDLENEMVRRIGDKR